MTRRANPRSPVRSGARSPLLRIASAVGGGAAALPSSGQILSRWSADTITPQADNTTFQTWTDAVGGVAATQASAGLRPRYRTNRVNGLPSVQFSGGQVLQIGRPAGLVAAIDAQLVTVFIVWKTLGAVANGCLLHLGGGFLQAEGTTVGRFSAGLTAQIPYAGQTNFSTLGMVTNSGYTNGAGTGIEHLAVNGGFVTQSPTMNSGTGGSGNLAIGADFSNGAFINVNAEIFDIVIWGKALTPAEMLQAQKWACDKYAQPYPWASSPYFAVFDGDSITAGIGATTASAVYPYKAAQTLGLAFGQWMNIGVGGDTVLNMHSRAPTWLDPVAGIVGKKVKVAAFEWYNQRGASPTPRNNSLTYIAARRTALTLMCWGTSTDNSDAAPDQNRVDYNTYFDANHGAGVMDSYVALHADANIGVEGSFLSNPGNWSDIVHLSDAGYTFLANLMAAGVAAIP
jgi:lysophospholipase L1-like esterase